MDDVALYCKDDKIGVLISSDFGATWSVDQDKRLAYDKRVIDFWLEHKDDKEFMRDIDSFRENPNKTYMEKVFSMYGYDDVYFGAFPDLELVWVEKGKPFKIREYDGSEWIEFYNPDEWTTF